LGLKKTLIKTIAAVLMIMFSSLSWAASPYYMPGKVYGNLGFFFTGAKAEEGAQTTSTHTTLSLNLDSYVWRPWFATFDVGTTLSATKTETAVTSNDTDLLSTHLNFSLMPRSRYPFRFTFNSNDNVDDWVDYKVSIVDLNANYKSRYMNARQSYITRSGDRYDAWYTRRARYFSGVDLTDETLGGKGRIRGKHYNLYANGTYQTRSNSVNSAETKHLVSSLTHNYFPTSEFYVKTLVSKTRSDDNVGSIDNGGLFGDRITNVEQLSSFFYWRPEYRPYTVTGGLRTYRRDADIINAKDTEQYHIDVNLAGNYKINRRLYLTATANASIINNEGKSDNGNFNQSVLLSYRSDRIRHRNYAYHWFSSAGISNRYNTEYQDTLDEAQSVNADIGHSIQRSWITGNRSTMRINITQSIREFVDSEADFETNLSHSASVNWNKEMKRGRFYSQITALDTRSLDETNETQIVNLQVSRTAPITRISQWGVHLSAQSSRQDTGNLEEDNFLDGFLTTINGRLNYQHARMFGIYKLKFRTDLDLSSTANRDGGDRKQADWSGRIGYNIGKLSTALVGRAIFSDSGLGNKIIYFQVNRSF